MHGVNAAVEGLSDEGVVEAIAGTCGLAVASFYGRRGKTHLLKSLPGYNAAAKFSPWLVLVDLDHDANTASEAERIWLSDPSPLMCFNVAVPEIEAWLLADRARVAEFLGISPSQVPTDPEQLPDPKQTLIKLARGSRRRDIREGVAPRDGSGALVGPTYAADLRNFGATLWRPRVAGEVATSLAACIFRVEELAEKLSSGEQKDLRPKRWSKYR